MRQWMHVRSNVTAILCAAFLGPCVCFAEAPRNLITESQLVTFEIVNGRIVTRNSRFGQSRGASARRSTGDVQESLSLKLRSGLACVQYERVTKTHRLLATCTAKRDFHLRSEPKNENRDDCVAFSQPTKGACRLDVGMGATQRSYNAPTLWHLIMARPQVCDKHLLPMLESLRPSWKLRDKSAEIEESLLRVAVSGQHTTRKEVWDLVQQMNAKSFRARHEADRKLRAKGQAVVGYLLSIQRSDVGAEQFRRIRSICESLQVKTPDIPKSVALRMLGDRVVWDALARRGHPMTREAAERQLQRLSLR